MNMACCMTVDSERRQSRQIDKDIAQWMKDYKKIIKFLLLGAGESGKSTILKQIKILHIQGFSESERKDVVSDIRRIILEAIEELIKGMQHLSPPEHLSGSDGIESLEYIHSICHLNSCDFPQIFYDHVIRLWSDPGIQKTFERMNEFPLLDSAKYFLDNVSVIRQENYTPTDQDILLCRKKTSDIKKVEVKMKVPKKYGGGEQTFWMFDVGGQRGERRKWIQVFDGITAVLFLVASSGFDMKLREDPLVNRLRESLNLFQDVWNSRFLKYSGFILLLNKQDQLKEKIKKGTRLHDTFPEYLSYKPKEDVSGEYEKARCFIRDLFLEKTKYELSHSRAQELYGSHERYKRKCFWHYTTAIDTQNVKLVFEDIHTTVVMLNLESFSPF